VPLVLPCLCHVFDRPQRIFPHADSLEKALLPAEGVAGTSMHLCVCGDVGREVIRLTHFQGQSQGQGPYLLLTLYTHGVPHVDCEGPCAVTRTNPLLPPGGKAPETCLFVLTQMWLIGQVL
jgi:hypothetical protein